jgi:hypothetical protein
MNMTTFFSANALNSLRAAGYKNTQFALAELIDNAFDWEAKNVKIIFFEKRDHQDKKVVEEIIVCDDGVGMEKAQLSVCLQFGNTGNTDIDEIVAKKKKGMYGFGLPNSSLSQCPCVHVFSRQKGKKFFSTYLDLGELKAKNSIEIPAVMEVAIPNHYVEAGGILDDDRGTIVAWRGCDRLSNTRAATLIEKSERLLGRLYRYLLNEGKTITLESWELNPGQGKYIKGHSVSVVPNDPLFLMENTYIARILQEAATSSSGISDSKKDPATYYKEFSLGKKKCKATNLKLNNHCFNIPFEWAGKTYQFAIVTSIADKRIQKPGIREGGRTAVGAFYGQKEHISFVRAGREISTGDYDLYKKTEPRHRWWTIEIQFNPDADPLLGVHNNKQGIEFVKTEHEDIAEEWNKNTATLQQAREHLWIKLTNLIALAIKDARKEVVKVDKDWDLTEGPIGSGGVTGAGLPSGTTTTIEAIQNTEGEKVGQFSEQDKADLFIRLRENYPDVAKEEIENSIQKFDQWKVRGVVLYYSSQANSLWELTSVAQFLIVLINTEHEFYKRVIAPLRTKKIEQAVAAIELFISSLAWEEHAHFTTDEKKKDIVEAYRNYAGLHLNTYLKDNDIAIDEDQLFSVTGNGSLVLPHRPRKF